VQARAPMPISLKKKAMDTQDNLERHTVQTKPPHVARSTTTRDLSFAKPKTSEKVDPRGWACQEEEQQPQQQQPATKATSKKTAAGRLKTLPKPNLIIDRKFVVH